MKKQILFVIMLMTSQLQSSEFSWTEFFRSWNEFNAFNREQLLQDLTGQTPQQRRSLPKVPSTPSASAQLSLSDMEWAVPQALLDLKDFIQNADRYAALGAKPPKGVLLVGPPGTGKTTMARALAQELDVPLISASATEFVEIYVGTGPKRVRELFAQATQEMKSTGAHHAIIFIDEIDAIGKRGADMAGGSSEDHKTLNELLTQMDGFTQANHITVIAATNCPESLDQALLRPGRFDEIITLQLPDYNQRLHILQLYLFHPKFKRVVDQTINLAPLATATQGWSAAELESVVNKAAIKAVREGAHQITHSALRTAFEEVRSMRSVRA